VGNNSNISYVLLSHVVAFPLPLIPQSMGSVHARFNPEIL